MEASGNRDCPAVNQQFFLGLGEGDSGSTGNRKQAPERARCLWRDLECPS